MDSTISPLCRFCLEQNEEFQHLATECPPLWWERHNISAQESNSPDQWTPQQIINFTFIPKIDEAFVRPLYRIETAPQQEVMEEGATQDQDDPDRIIFSEAESDMDQSVMDVSSLDDSSEYDDGMSIVSVCSESE